MAFDLKHRNFLKLLDFSPGEIRWTVDGCLRAITCPVQVPDTGLILVHLHVYGSEPGGMFALVDDHGSTVWSAFLPGDFAMPGDGEGRARLLALTEARSDDLLQPHARGPMIEHVVEPCNDP